MGAVEEWAHGDGRTVDDERHNGTEYQGAPLYFNVEKVAKFINKEDADGHNGTCYQDECRVTHLFLVGNIVIRLSMKV